MRRGTFSYITVQICAFCLVLKQHHQPKDGHPFEAVKTERRVLV